MNRLLAFAVLISLALPALSSTSITYQGQLQQQGQPFTGTANLVFELFDAETDGNAIGDQLPRPDWPVEDGLFQVALDFGANAFDGSARYLEVRVNGIALQPRQPIRPAPMALYAPSAGGESAWEISGSDIYYETGRVGIGTQSPEAELHAVASGTDAIIGRSATAGGRGVYGVATAATGVGVRGESNSTSGLGVFGYARATSGQAYGVLGQSDSTSGLGVYGWASASSGSTTGVVGISSSFEGRGVYGSATANGGVTYGVWGTSSSTSGQGVFGDATATQGLNFGVRGQSASVVGRGVFGLATAGTGDTFGVYGQSASNEGTGVLGFASAASGITVGIQGQSSSTSGRGVIGRATATIGSTFGVSGTVSSPSGYAAYFTGVSGSRNYFQRPVGIGTTSPTRQLHVRQASTSPSSSGITIQRATPSTNQWGLYVNAADGLSLVYDNTIRGSFDPGSGVYSPGSDARFKKNIEPIGEVLDRVLGLKPSTYHMNTEDDSAPRSIGLIAQEVQPLFPEIVTRIDDDGDLMGLRYSELSVLSVQAIIELNARLESNVSTLADENAELRAEVAVLKVQSGQMRELAERNAALETRLTVLESLLLPSADALVLEGPSR